MDAERLLTAFIGAFLGAAGWLVVGLFIQRQQFARVARNSARAVYFELAVNDIAVGLARQHAVFQPLARGTFDRLLPELAALLSMDDMQTVAQAYMGHAGYDQLQRDPSVPSEVRQAILARAEEQHRAATAVLVRCAFSQAERARLVPAGQASTLDSTAAPEVSA
ncbi:MAG: hypothetical protein M3395_00730 [Chloroflexota bacterium]|nr:hypothetical protein [Chloroflexota bacterium]